MFKYLTSYFFDSEEVEDNFTLYICEHDHVIQIKYLSSQIYNFAISNPTSLIMSNKIRLEPNLKSEFELLNQVINKLTSKGPLDYKVIIFQSFNYSIKFYITTYTNDKVLEVGVCDNEFDQNYFDNEFMGMEFETWLYTNKK
jgi:hypothetical protein